MIPRLTRSSPVTRRDPEWPEWPRPGRQPSGALFEARPSLRKLVVLADAELLAAAGDLTLSPGVVLSGLLTHPYIKLLRYRDEGPFADTPRRSYGPPAAGLTAAEGWAELLPPDGQDGRDLLYAAGSGPVYTGVWGSRAGYARSDITSAAYPGLDSGAAADQRERDALAAEVAEAMQADLFITERPYLFETRAAMAHGVTLCRPPEALALAAHYLRSQNEFIIWQAADGSGAYAMNEGLYYQVGAIELLPATWRWSKAFSQQSQATGDDTLPELYHSLLQRVQRSLKARDSLHRACNLPQDNDTARTALTDLDSILVSLMGAVDSSARVAHIALSLPANKPYDAGWQHQRWLGQVAGQQPTLAALFNAGTPLYHTLTILRLLRNTVHGQMMRTTAIQQAGHMRETAITLPSEHKTTILSSIEALGGKDTWGLRTANNGSSLADPALFVERLFPQVLTLVNEAMEQTPVERLSQVALTPADSQPPRGGQGGHASWYSERNRHSIRWQLGF